MANGCVEGLTADRIDVDNLDRDFVEHLANSAIHRYVYGLLCKLPLEKTGGQSRIDTLNKLSTLGAQDTGRRQTKQKTQDRKLTSNTESHQNPVANLDTREG